jgi:hypothetical protein
MGSEGGRGTTPQGGGLNERALGIIRLSEFARDRLAWAATDRLSVRRIRTGIAVPEPVVRLALPAEGAAT